MSPRTSEPLNMSAVGEEFSLSLNFDTEKLGPDILWYNPPKSFATKQDGTSGLKVVPRGKTDFWKRTYYKPEILKDDGHLLHLVVKQCNCVIETSFNLMAVNQFDQAGIMVRVDSDHWIKTGLEYVDGKFYMSSVITNKWSDWSRQSWADSTLALRIHKIQDDYVIECRPRGGTEADWRFVRITHLESRSQSVHLGVYTCAPATEGATVVFDNFQITPSDGTFQHKAS